MHSRTRSVLIAGLTAGAVLATGPVTAAVSNGQASGAATQRPTTEHRFDFGAGDTAANVSAGDPAQVSIRKPSDGRFTGKRFDIGPRHSPNVDPSRVAHKAPQDRRFDFHNAG